jgi:hypothetical protein
MKTSKTRKRSAGENTRHRLHGVVKWHGQLYTAADYVRIFEEKGPDKSYAVLDAHIIQSKTGDQLSDADAALKRALLRRLGPWRNREWGYEAIVIQIAT